MILGDGDYKRRGSWFSHAYQRQLRFHTSATQLSEKMRLCVLPSAISVTTRPALSGNSFDILHLCPRPFFLMFLLLGNSFHLYRPLSITHLSHHYQSKIKQKLQKGDVRKVCQLSAHHNLCWYSEIRVKKQKWPKWDFLLLHFNQRTHLFFGLSAEI